jgi:hypothetical protein
MAVITKINNIGTSGTTGINNIFGSGGGGSGLTAPSLGTNAGVQVYGGNISSVNTDLDASFNRGPVGLKTYSGTDFVRLAVKEEYNTAFAVTSDGKLHYATDNTTYLTGYTADGEWHEDTSSPSGTSGNWTDVTCDDRSVAAIRGGDVVFRGYGGDRQRGDGSTSTANTWVKTYDGSTDAAVRIYLGFRVSYLVTAAGKLYSCGYRYEGMTGEGTTSGQQPNWTDVTPSGVAVRSLGYGYRSCKFLDSNGDVWSFGNNSNNNSGPLVTSTSNILTPTQSTNTQPFPNGTIIGGGCSDMYLILDSSGQLWVQGEGYARYNPDGTNVDKKGAWASIGSSGTYTANSYGQGTFGSADQIMYLVRSDGSMDVMGLDGSPMAAAPHPTGVAPTGNPPFKVFTDTANNVHMASGNINLAIVAYG